MWRNPQETADLVTLTGEIVSGKLYNKAIYSTSLYRDQHFSIGSL